MPRHLWVYSGFLFAILWLTAGISYTAMKGDVVTYPAVPLVAPTDCLTQMTTAYQDQVCVNASDGKTYRCATPGDGGATDIAGNPLCNQSFEWQLMSPETGGYTQILDEGLPLNSRTKLNFGGAGVTCVDNSGQARTDCTISGGGAAGNEKTPAVAAVATVNLPNLAAPGAVHDGVTLAVTTPRQRLLLPFQTTLTQNGIYDYNGPSSLLTRSSDADQDAEFTANFSIKVQIGGTLYGGTTFMLQNTAAVTLGSSNINFIIQSWGAKGETTNNKNQVSGYAGLGSGLGRLGWNRGDQPAMSPDIGVASQIDVATLQAVVIGIQSATAGNVTMTTGNPRITGCTAANDGVQILLVGLSATKTVTIPNGQGVLLPGATGSVVVGQPPGGTSARFRCNGSTLTWEQTGVASLQQGFNAGNKILTGNTAATGLQIGDPAGGNYCVDFFDAANGNEPTRQCFCGGGSCDLTHRLQSGKNFLVKTSAGSTAFSVSDAGVVSGSFAKMLMGGQDNATTTCSSGGDSFYSFPIGRLTRGGAGQPNAEVEVSLVMNTSYTFSNFRFLMVDPLPSGQTATLTWRKNGAATPVTCSVIAGASVGSGEQGTTTDKECVDTTHSFSVVAGDRIALQEVCAGGTVTLGYFSFSINYQ